MGARTVNKRLALTAIPWLMAFVSLCGFATAAAAAQIVRLDIGAVAGTPARYPTTMIGKDTPAFDGSYFQRGQYDSDEGVFHVGLWESGPGTLVTASYPNDEYCLVLEGQLTVINQNGSRAEFKPGDSFVIPKGWAGAWRMTTRFKKQFVAFKPK